MYQYYKGLIIREGADGIKGDIIKKCTMKLVGCLQINRYG